MANVQLPRRPASPKIPHNFDAIMKRSDMSTHGIPLEKLYEHLVSGVLLDQKKKLYWVDPKSGCNCFMLFARDLSITSGEDKRFWQWTSMKEGSNMVIDVAELKQICGFEVCGSFDPSNLTPGIIYEVSFVVMLKESARGWEVPVNLVLGTPDGEEQECSERLSSMPKGEWVELLLGEFLTCVDDDEDLQFSLYEIEGRQWKSGLIIKGVVIQPKNTINEKPDNSFVEEKPSSNVNVSSGDNQQLTVTAKDLSIALGQDKRCWRWSSLRESSNGSIDVAELINVSRLDVQGKYTTSKLKRGLVYEVIFVVMLKDPSCGWEVPVNLQLVLPNGERQERKENLLRIPKKKWMELKVGEFKTQTGNAGKVQFSLFETEGNKQKKGLHIKGVIIRPRQQEA
ncbi:hypothetical protein NE237_002062 [Protea cynaroides]|uniref:Uncharacterized protein n=1 Tax=Protea cynaroides TaxID=273540 RepID=A0A9Q0KVC5_9MAGN|nr:hypothetical protein NE237_002062 [Protea cynaroides]